MPKQDDEKYPPIHPGGFLKEDFLVANGHLAVSPREVDWR